MNSRGQLTLFIILAIVVVGVVSIFFVFRGTIFVEKMPANFEPVYNTFLSCVEENTLEGINVLESQAGYIDLPDFESGSGYMPFSSQLNFFGNPVPYWYYISGNNIQKEQVPSKEEMGNQIESYIERKIPNCLLDSHYDAGFEIKLGEPKASVNIGDEEVEVTLNMMLDITKDEDHTVAETHNVAVKSKLGLLYNSAKKIYDYEQENLFLEKYAVDTLRLYAPVDGVELSCSPQVWDAEEVYRNLQESVEANTGALKIKDGDYTLKSKENNYFVVDVSLGDVDARFMNSRNWSNSFEVNPSEGSLLLAKPIGNQPGLGILGFCYVPYHFVYDLKYPVLVQVFSGDEIFQFPLAVVLQGNNPRQPLDGEAIEAGYPELCRYKNTPVDVNTYDMDLKPIEADISYECFGTRCDIGKTSIAEPLKGNFPQCVNGYILAKSEGYEDTKYLYSAIGAGSADIIMSRVYDKSIKLKLDGKDYLGNAIINFVSDKSSKTVIYPEQKNIELGEGQYEVQVYVYKNSSIKLEASTQEQCIDIPQTGAGGLLGLTEKRCFNVEIPAQIISNALSGGGKENYYFLDSELSGSNLIEVNAGSLPTPNSIEQLQNNYDLFEDKSLEVLVK
jgi:hypothetical protein